MVFQQYRELLFPDAAFSDLDMAIKVTMDKEGKLKFDATVWNITQRTWDSIEKGDSVQIKLGWADGPTEVVVFGTLDSKNREQDGNDMKFSFKGVDESSSAGNQRISNTWRNKDPGGISADIARSIGLTPQTVNTGQPISGNWSATQDQQAKKWLDELVTIAEEQTGVKWEWHGEQGELSFRPKNDTRREAPVLGWDTNLVEISEDSESDSDTEKLSFEAMLTPAIARGAALDVQVERFSGIWKVETYEHQSESTSGDHLTRGTLIPTDQEYSVAAERRAV